MGILSTGTLFIPLVVLLNSIELSSQAEHVVPPPYEIYPHRPSYVIENGVVYLTGDSIGSEAVIIDDYFLGTWEHNTFHPVDPLNEHSIINIRTRRFVTKSEDFITRLMLRHSIQSGRVNLNALRNMRRGGGGHDGAGPSNAGQRGGSP